MVIHSIDFALAAALGFMVWAWRDAAHRQSTASPVLGLIAIALTGIIMFRALMPAYTYFRVG